MSDSEVQGGPCRPRWTLQPSRDPAPEPADTDGGGDTCWGRGSPFRAPGLGLSPDPQPRGGRTPSLGNHPRPGPPHLPAGAPARGPSSPTVGVDAAQQVLPQAHGVERGGHVHLLTGLEFHFGHVFLFEQPLPRRPRGRHCGRSRHNPEQAETQARASEESGSRAPRRRCPELTT